MQRMKLAFSTLGCPDWSVEQVVRAAADLGYDGVEIRGFGGTMDIATMPELNEHAAQTRRLFESAKIAVCCLSTGVSLSDRDRDRRREQMDLAHKAIRIASSLGCPFVRVFGGRIPAGQSRADCADDVAQALTGLGGAAAPLGVTLLLETHDDFCEGKHAADVMDRVGGPGVGVLWDILHPYRCGERLADTLNYLGGRIRHVHVKDALELSPQGFRPTLLGEGAMPVRDAIDLLRRTGYAGYLSLEWEKAWHPEIPEPEVALPQYVTFMRALLSDL